MSTPVAPMIIRGEVITDHLIEAGGRGGDFSFQTPDARKYLDRFPLGSPTKLANLYDVSMEEILDYIEELGRRLAIDSNPFMQEACALGAKTSPVTPAIFTGFYQALPNMCNRERVREMVESAIGVDYLEGWVRRSLIDGRDVEVKCFGSRTLHIIAGNAPTIALSTIVKNLVLRSDAVIKAPSNDPFTAVGIARTMIEMAPDHPLTKHLSVAYWRGGDEVIEEQLYQPHNFEKIMAWGGFASVKHVTKYIQPGLELISMDPKRSASIIGSEAFESEEKLREAALRLASDFGGANQVGCVNARVVYALCGTDDEGVEKLNRLGAYAYEALSELPERISTKPKSFDRELKANLDALRLDDEWYKVIGGEDEEGAVVVSQMSDPVSFATQLNDRVANLVPVDEIDDVIDAVDAYTQTVGVYPESLKDELKDILPLHGAQRIVSLGYAISTTAATPSDGIEPMRRLGKWIVNEICADKIVGPWGGM